MINAAAVARLYERLDRVYAGAPFDAPPDRAFASVVEQFDMPRALPEALLEGLAWDAQFRRYDSLADLNGYSARVASAVGAMMCVLMRVRDRGALARACDLGVAMQLTNMARDVGEDALEGRLYLPLEWLDEAGIDPEAFLADPRPSKAVRAMVRRMVVEANRLYMRSEAGVPMLPRRCRPGIFAARHIYAGIGSELMEMGYDSISARAHTSKTQKIGWLGQSILKAGFSTVMPRSAVQFAEPLPEVRFLVDAAADKPKRSKMDGVFDTLRSVESRRQKRELGLTSDPAQSR